MKYTTNQYRPCRLPITVFLLNVLVLISPLTVNAGPSALEQEVIDLVNVERSKVGKPALVYEERLAIAARCFAIDMAENNYFPQDHKGLDGSSPDQRIERAGYVWSAWGENIAAGPTTAQDVVNAWMNSAPHRANILGSNDVSKLYTEIGIGHGYNDQSDNGHYWVQDFGTPGSNPHNPVDNYCRGQYTSANPVNIIPATMLLLN